MAYVESFLPAFQSCFRKTTIIESVVTLCLILFFWLTESKLLSGKKNLVLFLALSFCKTVNYSNVRWYECKYFNTFWACYILFSFFFTENKTETSSRNECAQLPFFGAWQSFLLLAVSLLPESFSKGATIECLQSQISIFFSA